MYLVIESRDAKFVIFFRKLSNFERIDFLGKFFLITLDRLELINASQFS